MSSLIKFFFVSLSVLIAIPAFGKGLPVREVRALIKKNSSKFNDCYFDAKKKNPDIKGRVVIGFEINDQAVLSNFYVNKKRSEFNVPEFNKCMHEKLKSIQFPATPAGQILTVTYPFVFKK